MTLLYRIKCDRIFIRGRMRRKKTDYTGHYSPSVKHSTALSQGSSKHKDTSVKAIDASVLDGFSRYHSGKYSQYRFKISGNALMITISQCGNINHAVREFTLGSITEYGQFKLSEKIFLSRKKSEGTIFHVANLVGVECDRMILQCQDCCDRHSAYGGKLRIPDKPSYKPLSGSNWKLKKRI